MINFGRKLSPKTFIISQVAILVASLIFLGGLHYIINVQYQKKASRFSLGPITQKPSSLTLELLSFDDDLLSFDKDLLITGKTLPKAQVYISSGTEDLVIQAKADGSFSGEVFLAEGVNNIQVTVFDPRGEQKSVERMVFYSKEKI